MAEVDSGTTDTGDEATDGTTEEEYTPIPLEPIEPVHLGIGVGVPEPERFHNGSHTAYGDPYGVIMVSDKSLFDQNMDIGQESSGTVEPNEVYLNRPVHVYQTTAVNSLNTECVGGYKYESLSPFETFNVMSTSIAYEHNHIKENEHTSLYTWSE